MSPNTDLSDVTLEGAPGGARKEEASQVGALKALELRLAAAVGPDRELDHELAMVVGWSKRDLGAHCFCWIEPSGEHTGEHPPHYTSSIDAALTLMPDGCDWVVASVNGHVGGTPYACAGSFKEHFAETPVLSACLAAIHARISHGQE